MRIIFKTLIAFLLLIPLNSHSEIAMTKPIVTEGPVVRLETSKGDILIRLSNLTPAHRDNFLKLVREGKYNGVLFHRVIDNFMIQSGDVGSVGAPKGKMLGSGDVGYRVDAEFRYPKLYHRRGMLAAAREGDDTNPGRKSSGSQFYIVTGKVFNDSSLTQMERRMNMENERRIWAELQKQNRDSIMALRRARDNEGLEKLRLSLVGKLEKEMKEHPAVIPEDIRMAYKTVGGTPHLDGAYTVYGEVIDGMDVVDAIQKADTDQYDRPEEDITIIKATVVEEK